MNKDYYDVNKERYEKIDYLDVENNIYAPINPVGNYSLYAGYKACRWFLIKLKSYSNKKYGDMRLLDVGCGDGHISRIMVDLLGCPENIDAFDFSENNINHCKRLNPVINYRTGNVVQGIPFEIEKYDGITAFVVLSHLREDEDVKKALKNIHDALDENGLFLWYELVSKSHYINKDKDTQGFNNQEMNKFAAEVGFTELYRSSFSRTVWFGNRSRSIYYSARENNIWFLEAICKLLPLRPTITIRVYKKNEI